MASLLVASLVVREIGRRRLALAVVILTLAYLALSAWGFGKLAGADANGHRLSPVEIAGVVSVLVVLMAFMFANILVLGAAFLGSLGVGMELESGLLLAILPRPLRRSEFLLGKWLGVCAVLAGYGAFAAILELAVIRWRTGYVPPHPLAGLVHLFALATLALTFAMTLSVRMPAVTAAFVTIVLYGVAWIVGIVHAVSGYLGNAAVAQGTLAASLFFPTDALWRGVLYELEPVAMLAVGLNAPGGGGPFAVTGPPSTALLWWAFGWFAVVAAAGVASFRTRDV